MHNSLAITEIGYAPSTTSAPPAIRKPPSHWPKLLLVALLSVLIVVEPPLARANWFTEHFHKHPVLMTIGSIVAVAAVIGIGIVTWGVGDEIIGSALSELFIDAAPGTSASIFNSTATAEETIAALEADGFTASGETADGLTIYEDANGNQAIITPSNTSPTEGALQYKPNGGPTIKIHLGMSN